MPAQSKSDKLREYLLPITIAHAIGASPFHRRRLEGVKLERIDQLSALPLLYKRDLVEHVDEMRTLSRFPDALFYTSGTTGKPLEVPIYREEVQAQDDVLLPAVRERIKQEPPLTLTVLRVGHGNHVLSSSIPSIPCHISYGIDQLVQFLRQEHWVNGKRVPVKNLELNVLNLRQVTRELLDAGYDPASFGLETISMSGWYVPDFEREQLARIWNALLLDRYGVTEVNGDAKWCFLCKGYHFDFTVVPEFIDPDDSSPVSEGVASMVMTGLYPFNQAIPKIRYFVGDLVHVSNARCGLPEKTVRFLSRLTDAVRAPRGATGDARWRLFSADVAEALAPLPDVARKDKTGFLKFKLSATESCEAKVDIELAYSPALYSDRVAELKTRIVAELGARRKEALGNPVVEFFGPGKLEQTTKV